MNRVADPVPPGTFPETSLGGYLPSGRRPSPDAGGPTGHAAIAAFESAMVRLEEAIGLETSALEAGGTADLDEINRLKSRSLLELTRLTRGLPAAAGERLAEPVARLHGKLLRNQAVLKRHLDAVQEIAGLLAHALGEADSDGTYGMAQRRRGTAR
jgi:hypothetical protein